MCIKVNSEFSYLLIFVDSLSSWDNMRHIALKLDKHVRHSINYTFWSIALYGKLCFILILLCLFDLPFMKSINYCDESIIFYNMHMDLVLYTLVIYNFF